MQHPSLAFEAVVDCVDFMVYDFARKTKEQQQGILIDWMRYAEVMKRELGYASTGGKGGSVKAFLLPGSNGRLICGNATARLIGYSRKSWATVKTCYKQKTAPQHGLRGKAGNKKNQEYEDILHEFFIKVEAMAEPRATKVVRDIVGDQVEFCLRGDEHIVDLPAYLTKRGLYKKLLADHDWQYTFSSKQNITDKKKLSEDAAAKMPTWSTFRNFWKKHYSNLVIQKPSEDICGECHRFAISYKTLNRRNKSNNATSNDDSDDSETEDESTGLTEEVLAVDLDGKNTKRI